MSNGPSQKGSYLGRRGYCVPKARLTNEEQVWLRQALCVRPSLPNAPVQPPAFPVYRESGSKFYLPRHFGVETYGEPDEIKIEPGSPIHLPFAGSLRDYQQNIVETYRQSLNQDSGGGGLLEIPCGRGKTVIALNIISALSRKTLVVVHKSFLLNQWVERIQQFLPSARIGKIQGPELDVDDKDIVIGMLQSLSMKEYPPDTFRSFGLTIVDECHHISSEVFSRSLLKIVTKFTLGLSATMQRKDGLTPVFKMFLGDVVYKEARRKGDPVLVRALQYTTTDRGFNEQLTDFRGRPAYSPMITKLCDFNHRSEFILRVMEQERSELPDQQVMILSQNKSLLTYLFRAIEHRGLATVGFYVGGMKESALKATETCSVILATYAMAAEALDIKTLTTLILATPRTDVRQAVGRILRVAHSRPLVVDIVDPHDVFQRQWAKRRAYYLKQHYTVHEISSAAYPGGQWETVTKNSIKKKSTASELPKGQCLLSI